MPDIETPDSDALEQQQDPEGGRVRHAAPLFLGGGEVGIGAR